jgi:hypothetical protein
MWEPSQGRLLLEKQQVRSAKYLQAQLLLLLKINNVFTQKKNSDIPDGFTGRR